MKKSDFVKHLKTNGCTFVRQGNKHEIYENSAKNLQSSVPRHNEIRWLTVKKICKELDIQDPSGR